jgi:hypothetical protein
MSGTFLMSLVVWMANIRIVCPTDSGAMILNYKKYLSVVLQALLDANCKFITVDIGGFGKQGDGSTFLASDLFSFIDRKRIIFPERTFFLTVM